MNEKVYSFKLFEKDIKSRTIVDVDLSFDSKFSAFIDNFGYLYLVDEKGKEVLKRKVSLLLNSVGVSNRGSYIVTADKDTVYFYNKFGKLDWKKKFKSKITCVEISGNDNTVVVGTESGMIFSVYAIGEIKWKYDARDIYKALYDNYIKNPDILDKALDFFKIKKLPPVKNNPINKIDISPNSDTICFCTRNGYIGINSSNGKSVWNYCIDLKNMKIAVSNNGENIVCSSENGTILYFEKSMKIIFQVKINYKITSIALSGDGNTIAVGTKDTEIVLLNRDSEIIGQISLDYIITSISFSNDGKRLLVGTSTGIVYLFELNSSEKKINSNKDEGFIEIKKDENINNYTNEKKKPKEIIKSEVDFLEI